MEINKSEMEKRRKAGRRERRDGGEEVWGKGGSRKEKCAEENHRWRKERETDGERREHEKG